MFILEKEGTYTLKVKMLSESYDTTSIKLTKKNFPLPYETKFVTVVTAYEKYADGAHTGVEYESVFSNRIMFSTPKRIGFGISINSK